MSLIPKHRFTRITCAACAPFSQGVQNLWIDKHVGFLRYSNFVELTSQLIISISIIIRFKLLIFYYLPFSLKVFKGSGLQMCSKVDIWFSLDGTIACRPLPCIYYQNIRSTFPDNQHHDMQHLIKGNEN